MNLFFTMGGKPGLVQTLQKPFEKRKKEVKTVIMMYSRDDMQCRREKTPMGSINQIETQLRITAEVSVKPLKQGMNYKCWNDGNGFGPIRLPAWGAKNTMMAPRSEKKAIFAEMRIPVGGVGRIWEEPVHESAQAKRRRLAASPDEVEPVFFHCPSKHFFEDEFTMSNCSAVVDFTPGPGYLLYSAIHANVPSVGFCISKQHHERLRMHLIAMTLADMSTEGNDGYEPRFEKLLQDHGDAEGLQTPSKSSAQKPKAVAKKRLPARAASQKPREEDDPEPPEEDPAGPPAPGSKTEGQPPEPAEQKLLDMLARMNAAGK